MSMVARRRVLMAQRRWAEAGTLEAMEGHLEEEVNPEEEVSLLLPASPAAVTAGSETPESH